jgi:hypothetical protein
MTSDNRILRAGWSTSAPRAIVSIAFVGADAGRSPAARSVEVSPADPQAATPIAPSVRIHRRSTAGTYPVGLPTNPRNLDAVAATTLVFMVIAAVLVFAIAAGTVGREAHRLDAIAPRAVYQLDEAVDFVADRLPAASQARLTPAEVEALLIAHLRWLHEQGLQPDKVVDARQSIDENVIISEDALVAYLLAAAEEADVELLDDVDAVNVVDAHLEYFQAIGAVGPQAPLDDVL